MISSFDDLIASRREWIENVLKPWCGAAGRKDLQRAELEWGDIAGRVDAQATLWTWAWSRFPALVHEGLPGVNETHQVEVTLRDGSKIVGFPDNRRSRQGGLVLVGTGTDGSVREHGPFSIDEITTAERTS